MAYTSVTPECPGLRSRGEHHPKARLTEAAVRRMRVARAHGATLYRLAVLYRITRQAVRNAISGDSWGHIEGGIDDVSYFSDLDLRLRAAGYNPRTMPKPTCVDCRCPKQVLAFEDGEIAYFCRTAACVERVRANRLEPGGRP